MALCGYIPGDTRTHAEIRRDYMKATGEPPDSEYLQWFDNGFETEPVLSRSVAIHGSPGPTDENTAFRYTHIPSAHNCPPLTIRWWADPDHNGYNFDIIDPETSPPKSIFLENLFIMHWYRGDWQGFNDVDAYLCPLEFDAELQADPSPLQWRTEPGSRIRLQILSADRRSVVAVLGEAIVPLIHCEEYKLHRSFETLDDAIKHVS